MSKVSRLRQRGVAAVELGFVLIMLMFVVFGITEIGRAMYQYDALTKSARAAARYLATRTASSPDVQAAAKCVAVYGVARAPCSGDGLVPAAPGLTLANVVLSEPLADARLRLIETEDRAASIDVVTVTISPPSAPYRFQSIVPWIFPSIDFGPIDAAMPQVFF